MAFIGTAGWAIPSEFRESFPSGDSVLARYSRRFNAVEINTSFYRSHKLATYVRWAETVPEAFRFAVKMPKTITHLSRLKESDELIHAFSQEVSGLGRKLGVVLIQLPPSLSFEFQTAARFFDLARTKFSTALAIEPRHPTWFTDEASEVLEKFAICRVDADPTVPGKGSALAPSEKLYYLRLHGSPQMYYSEYSKERLGEFQKRMQNATEQGKEVWCIFDNTAAGRAVPNALSMSMTVMP